MAQLVVIRALHVPDALRRHLAATATSPPHLLPCLCSLLLQTPCRLNCAIASKMLNGL